MLNTPVQAAAEGMPVSKTMTRRAALCGIATLPALGGATAALAAIHSPFDPWIRTRELADEIKATLGKIEGVEDVTVSVTMNHTAEERHRAAHPDAELVRLGAEFDAVRVKSDAAWWEWQAMEDAYEEMHPTPPRHTPSDEFMAYATQRLRYLEANDTAYEARDAMLNELDGICKRVRAIEPKTLAGLAVWGRCMAWDCMNPGDFAVPLQSADWNHEQIRRFVAVVDKMAGSEAAI